MKLALCTDVLADLAFPEMLDRVKQYGINGVEMTAGGWSPCPHVKTEELLASPAKLGGVLRGTGKTRHGNRCPELFG